MSLTRTDKNTLQDILLQLSKNTASVTAIHSLRETHSRDFEKMGLPGIKHEEYRNTPLTKVLEKFDFSVQPAQTTSFPGIENFLVPGLDSYSIVIINGFYSAKHSAANIPGVTCLPLDEAINQFPEKVLPWLSQIEDGKQDPFSAWNGAGWTNGIFLMVPDNFVLDKPLTIYHMTDAREGEVVNIARNLFVIGRNSEATVLQKFNSTGEHKHFANVVTEVAVNENGGFNLYSVQNDAGDQYQFNHTRVYQKNASRVNSWVFTLDGKLVRNNLWFSLDGEGCESHMNGLYLLKGDTLTDNHTVVDHQKPNSFSNELYKGIMDGNSRGVFNGKIYVRPNAQKTNAFQSNRNILLTDSAKVNTKPQLEIWADDVKCSHGCTTGQLDEEALFYLQSRGIDKPSAQAMLLYAFAGEVIDTVPVEVIREYLIRVISERLHQNQ